MHTLPLVKPSAIYITDFRAFLPHWLICCFSHLSLFIQSLILGRKDAPYLMPLGSPCLQDGAHWVARPSEPKESASLESFCNTHLSSVSSTLFPHPDLLIPRRKACEVVFIFTWLFLLQLWFWVFLLQPASVLQGTANPLPFPPQLRFSKKVRF